MAACEASCDDLPIKLNCPDVEIIIGGDIRADLERLMPQTQDDELLPVLRTLLAEAGFVYKKGRPVRRSYEDMRMIAEVIKRRAALTGKTPKQIVMEPKQFSWWANPELVKQYNAMGYESPDIQLALRAWKEADLSRPRYPGAVLYHNRQVDPIGRGQWKRERVWAVEPPKGVRLNHKVYGEIGFRGTALKPGFDPTVQTQKPAPVVEVTPKWPSSYTVKPGDTLSGIGKRFNVDWRKIYELNKAIIGKDPNKIYPGTTLKLPRQKPEILPFVRSIYERWRKLLGLNIPSIDELLEADSKRTSSPASKEPKPAGP